MAKSVAAATPMPGGGLRMEASRAARAPKKHHIDHISIHKAKGGVTVRHHHAYTPGMGQSAPDKDHVFTNDQFDSHLVPHMRRHLGMKKADASGVEPGANGGDGPEIAAAAAPDPADA